MNIRSIVTMMAAGLLLAAGAAYAHKPAHSQQTPPPAPAPAPAAEKNKFDKDNMSFNQEDVDAIQAWWSTQNHADAPKGLRPEDKLPPDMDAQVKVGFVMADAWRAKTDLHPVPPGLLKKLPRLPLGHFIYAFGGHYIVLVRHHDWLIEGVVSVQ